MRIRLRAHAGLGGIHRVQAAHWNLQCKRNAQRPKRASGSLVGLLGSYYDYDAGAGVVRTGTCPMRRPRLGVIVATVAAVIGIAVVILGLWALPRLRQMGVLSKKEVLVIIQDVPDSAL